MAFVKGDRVRKLDGEAGTVIYSPVPGHSWVLWDDHSYYPVSDDRLWLITSAFKQQARELIEHWRKAAAQLTAAGFDVRYGRGLADAANALEDLLTLNAEPD